MGLLIVLLLVAVAGWVVWKLLQDPDKNDDGKVDVKDVALAAKEVAVEAKAHAEKAAEVAVEKVKKARKPKAPKA